MAMSAGGGGSKPDINVTPLVDVVLVLLIIFMVVTPLLEKEMPMKLPEIEKNVDTNPPPPDPNDENLVLYITKDDEIKYNGSAIQMADIDAKLGPLLKSKDKDGHDRV